MKVTPNQEMNELLNAGSVFNIVIESGSVAAVGTLNNEIIFNETISTNRMIGNYQHDVQFKIFSVGGIAEVTESLVKITENEDIYTDIYKRDTAQPRTASASYTGNGTAQTVTLGYRPDFVIVKGDTTQQSCWANRFNFYRRNDHFLNIASFGGQFGIQITDTGFTLGNDSRVNANGVTYYYFAYCDNGSNNLLQGNWQGNGAAGRTVDIFNGNKLSGALVKRDSPQGMVYFVADATSNYFFNGSSNAVSTGSTLNGDTGVFTLGSGNEVNQWSGILGEGANCLAFPKNSNAVHVLTYTGTGSARRINFPFELECFILAPRSTSVATTRAWFSALSSGQHAPLTNLALGTGEFTVTRNSILFSGTAGNNSGVEYVIYGFRKLRTSSIIPLNVYPNLYPKTLHLESGGYVSCGTSDTLAVTGDLTMEWYGTVYNPDTVQYTASATVDIDAGNQDKITPLIFRSNGTDTSDNAVNYGMAIAAPQLSTDTDWAGTTILVSTHDRWGLLQSTSGNLDNHPMNTGFVIDSHDLVHIVATHQGAGIWKVYVNGVQVKERKRDMLAAIGRPNVQGFNGMTTVIGARKRSTIDNANGCSFKFARIYNKVLTANEVLNNYLSIGGKAEVTHGFIEEWNVSKSSGSTILATVNTANNGVITNGVII